MKKEKYNVYWGAKVDKNSDFVGTADSEDEAIKLAKLDMQIRFIAPKEIHVYRNNEYVMLDYGSHFYYFIVKEE